MVVWAPVPRGGGQYASPTVAFAYISAFFKQMVVSLCNKTALQPLLSAWSSGSPPTSTLSIF